MYIVFQRRRSGLFSWLVRLWTGSEFVHCEAVFGTTMVSAVPGVGVRAVVVLAGGGFDQGSWEIVQIDASPRHEQDAYWWAIGEVGSKYDWLGILMCQVLRWGRQHKARWFCSEFCAALLQQTGQLRGVKPHQQSPGDLYYLLTGVRK